MSTASFILSYVFMVSLSVVINVNILLYEYSQTFTRKIVYIEESFGELDADCPWISVLIDNVVDKNLHKSEQFWLLQKYVPKKNILFILNYWLFWIFCI